MSLLRALFDRRSYTIGAESISQDPSKPLIAALGGSPGVAGLPVTTGTAFGLPALFACDRVIYEDIAKTPIKIKRREKNGEKETRRDDPDHPVYVLMHDLANPAMTAVEFKAVLQSSLNRWGNGYAEIQRNRRNEPVALWPLEPSRMEVGLTNANQLRYRYRMLDGTKKEWLFDPANPPIFHLRQNALPDAWWIGRSPITVVREAVGTALARQRYQARFYGQGGHAGILLTTPQPLTKEAAKTLRADFEEITSGEVNFHRTAVMPFGVEAKPLAMPHRDAQFVDQLKLSRSELAGIYRIYGQKINDLERATFSNVTELNIAHVGDCLGPHFKTWTQTIARDLLNPRSFNTHFATFKIDDLVRGDFEKFVNGVRGLREEGVLSANDIRRLMDMDDQISEDDGGNLYLVNGALKPMGIDPAMVIGIDDAPAGGLN